MRHLDPLELDEARAGASFPHLEACADCQADVARLRDVGDRLRALHAVAVPDSVDKAVLGLIPARVSRRRLWIAAAAVLLAAALGALVRLPGQPTIVDAYRLAAAGRDPEPVARACVKTTFLAIVLGVQEEARFRVVDVYVDSGEVPLAAWQVEITGRAKIVGVEGEDTTPHYDPAALMGGRIVLASFTTDASPPTGRRRVARLHMMESGDPGYEVRLVAAARPGGERIEAKVQLGGDK